jgi:sulfocyanin
VILAACLLASAPSGAQTQTSPSWLAADPATRTVVIDVVAAFNENNSNWNFNGYHTGGATVLVPTGWTVEVPFVNEEADVPHSLVVMADPGSEDEYPTEAAEDAAAFAGAYSASPVEGTAKGSRADFTFTADKAGDYLWYCSVPGHGNAGMWIRFRVNAEAQSPTLFLADDAEPGRE